MVIHPVEDPGEAALVLTLTQQPFHPISELRLGDFTGIGWTDRRNMVGVVEASLQKRDLAVKLQAMNVIERPRQFNVVHMPRIEHPLVGQVMHRKDRLSRVAARRQVGRRQARMPVVGVNNVRAPERIQAAGHLATDPSQQRKAQHVVGIGVLISIVVRAPWAIVEMRGINQIDAHAVKVTEQQSDAPGKRLAARHHLRIRHAAADIRKRGQQYARVDAPGNLRCRQRADHIRQSTGF